MLVTECGGRLRHMVGMASAVVHSKCVTVILLLRALHPSNSLFRALTTIIADLGMFDIVPSQVESFRKACL